MTLQYLHGATKSSSVMLNDAKQVNDCMSVQQVRMIMRLLVMRTFIICSGDSESISPRCSARLRFQSVTISINMI
eukprot:1217-Heterococcus_DN1.PRE.3